MRDSLNSLFSELCLSSDSSALPADHSLLILFSHVFLICDRLVELVPIILPTRLLQMLPNSHRKHWLFLFVQLLLFIWVIYEGCPGGQLGGGLLGGGLRGVGDGWWISISLLFLIFLNSILQFILFIILIRLSIGNLVVA